MIMTDTFWFIFNAFFSEFFTHIYMVVFSIQFLGKPKRLPMILFISATFIYLPSFFIYSQCFHGDLMLFAKEDRTLLTVVDITLIALYYYFAFRPQKPKKIFMCAAVNYICFMMSDILSAVLIYFAEMYTGADLGIFTQMIRTDPYYSFVFLPVGGFMYLIMFLLKRIYYKKIRFSGVLTFAIFPITQFIILHTFVIILQQTYVPKNSGYILFLFLVIVSLSLVSNVFLLRIMKKSKEKEMLEQKVRFFEDYQGLSQQYQEQIETTSRDLSKLRHDFNNHMEVLRNLINDSCIKDASQLADELRLTYSSEKYKLRFCENEIANVILRQTAKNCENKGIAFEASCTLSEDVALKKADICSLLTNLLSNAMRACEEMDDGIKCMNCSIWQAEDMIFFKVHNSKSNDIRISESRIITTRKNKAQHGFGIEIIEHIADVYGGTVSIEYDEQKFMVIVQLNLPVC